MKRIVILGAAAVLLAAVAWTQTEVLRTGMGTARGQTGTGQPTTDSSHPVIPHDHFYHDAHTHPLPTEEIRRIVRDEIAAAGAGR